MSALVHIAQTARALPLCRVSIASATAAASFLHQPRRGFANRFNRRPTPAAAPTSSVSVSSSAVAPVRSSELSVSSPPPAGVSITGDEAQVAQVRLKSYQSFKVDPSSLIAVPQGVEVRAVYGAPQPQMEQQQYYQQQQQQQQPSGVGGLLSRLRTAPPPQQQQMQQPLATAPMLAEVSLQHGQSTTDAVELGPSTAAKLYTLPLDEVGGEAYIARGSFLAAPSSVNLHNVDEPTGIPGLVLQRVDGVGSVVLKVSGQPISRQLGSGEQMYAQANRLVAVESTVQVRGGDGLLLTLIGPGRVLLQSLPSLEVALSQQAEQTQQILQANGITPPPGMQSSGFAMGPMGAGMGGGLGSMVMQGMAFGVGSSIAHHAIGSMFGGGHGASAASSAPEPAAAPPAAEPEMRDDLDSGSSNEGDGSFFGSMFGSDEDGGGDDGGDGGDW